MSTNRATFGSKLGVILATVGCAVGLGSIWRFPYMVASNGGGAFMIVFLIAMLTAGIPIMILAATLGSLLGAIVLYYIGKIFNKERLKRIVNGKIGKVLRLKASDIEKADKWFDTKGNKTVFFCRFIPIVRSLISIPAGMSEMPMQKFLLYTILGSLIWNTVLIIVGSIVGDKWETIVGYLDNFSNIILIILAIIFVVALYYWFVIRKKKQNKKA